MPLRRPLLRRLRLPFRHECLPDRIDGAATADRTPVTALPKRCPATGRLRPSIETGAGWRTRPPRLSLTRRVLCRLSYGGADPGSPCPRKALLAPPESKRTDAHPLGSVAGQPGSQSLIQVPRIRDPKGSRERARLPDLRERPDLDSAVRKVLLLLGEDVRPEGLRDSAGRRSGATRRRGNGIACGPPPLPLLRP